MEMVEDISKNCGQVFQAWRGEGVSPGLLRGHYAAG